MLFLMFAAVISVVWGVFGKPYIAAAAILMWGTGDAAAALIGIPFEYYDTFVIEEKYGLNRTTKKTFVLDTIKSWIIATVLGYALVAVIMFLYERFGDPGIVLICIAFILLSTLLDDRIQVCPLKQVVDRIQVDQVIWLLTIYTRIE